MSSRTTPRRQFRLLTRTRGGYDGAVMHDVQLQVTATGALVWSQTFTDRAQAEDFHAQVEDDLDRLAPDEFRSKYGVPAST